MYLLSSQIIWRNILDVFTGPKSLVLYNLTLKKIFIRGVFLAQQFHSGRGYLGHWNMGNRELGHFVVCDTNLEGLISFRQLIVKQHCTSE